MARGDIYTTVWEYVTDPKYAVHFLTDPKFTKWLSLALLAIDAVLCALIIKTIPYTEIDWIAYMQQIKQTVAGERDYTKIEGQTGPLVYPAGHVFLYRGLYELTSKGTNILVAQMIFAVLYIFNLGIVMACYRAAKAPGFIFPMLILSKRLHSIYLLRCFNDCWAMGALFLAIYFYQRRDWTYGTLAYTLGVSVKMNLLLALPAVAIILYQAIGPSKAYKQALVFLQIQVLVGLPFLRRNWRGYLTRAFDLSRQFEYQWTVNWKFFSEEAFLSKKFSIALLVIHAAFLGLFISTRWFKPMNRTPRAILQNIITDPSPEVQKLILRRVTPEFIITTILTSMAIGMLCARSLHYQFFSWIAWATPLLLWRSKLNPALQYFIWFGQEMAWNIYPSNELSSRIVFGVLAATVIEIWLGTDEPPPIYGVDEEAVKKDE